MNQESKAKSFLLSLIVGLMYFGGLKDFVIETFGTKPGVLIMAFGALALTLIISYMKAFMNTSNSPSNWTKTQIYFNILTFILLVIGIVTTWAADNSISLSTGFLTVMTKISIYCNMGLGAATTDWSQFRAKALEEINKP